MSTGITYFRLKSQYEGDTTKNCALDGYEVDSNFYTLEGRDIKSVTVEDDKIVITLMNGETISSDTFNEDVTKDLSFEFDASEGILYITRNGETQEISGFSTTYNSSSNVATNGTIIGNGTKTHPIGLSNLFKTGTYKPVKKIIDITKKQKLPEKNSLKTGDRYVTIEYINEFGLLYNYKGIKQIAADLESVGSQWRVPTKSDWDVMLNAVEPDESDKNHAAVTTKYLGRYAGKFLKSKKWWLKESSSVDTTTCIDYDDGSSDSSSCCECDCDCNNSEKIYTSDACPNYGIDKYGMTINPAGYADDGQTFAYFQERAWFWTSDVNSTTTNIYTKRFDYDRSSVYQDALSRTCYLSLRLVKDYDGSNYLEREDILGQLYTTVMLPTTSSGNAIWTSVNIGLQNQSYGGIRPNDGIGMVDAKRYFINEWNGQRWMINEIREGESVVVMSPIENGKNIEYRIIHGEMVNVNLMVYNDVLATIKPELDELDDKIKTETVNREAADITLQNSIDTEASTREEADTTLQENIDAEASAREEADTTLQENIDAEASAREEADTTLQENIDTEVSAREEADTTLQENIDAEASAREEADTALQESIDTLKENVAAAFVDAVYDKDTGILTLKSNDGTNDIKIQLAFNFGNI